MTCIDRLRVSVRSQSGKQLRLDFQSAAGGDRNPRRGNGFMQGQSVHQRVQDHLQHDGRDADAAWRADCMSTAIGTIKHHRRQIRHRENRTIRNAASEQVGSGVKHDAGTGTTPEPNQSGPCVKVSDTRVPCASATQK
jgi:hypothetical protein